MCSCKTNVVLALGLLSLDVLSGFGVVKLVPFPFDARKGSTVKRSSPGCCLAGEIKFKYLDDVFPDFGEHLDRDAHAQVKTKKKCLFVISKLQ